jgi:hypothetical protein
MRWQVGLLVVVIGCALAAPCSADFITGVTATAGSVQSTYYASRMTDGVGMSDNPVVKSSTMGNETWGDNSWSSDHGPAAENMWVKFDFAAPTSLNEMVIWNGNMNADAYSLPGLWKAGIKGALITYSTGTDTSGEGHTLFSGNLNMATGQVQGYTNDLFVPGGPVDNVSAVKLVYTSNWSVAGEGLGVLDTYQLSEVRFDNGISTPEPGTIVLLTTGLLGLLAYAWRKRK